MNPLIAAVAAWIERRFPSARWETRADDELRALLPFGRFDIEAKVDAGSLRVSTALEDCRNDDDEWLDDSFAEWEERRDGSPFARDTLEVFVDGRVIYARFFIDHDATAGDVESRLTHYVGWLESSSDHRLADMVGG